jgi:hypothetical protein
MLRAQNSDDAILALVEVHHPDLPASIFPNNTFYATSDSVPTVSNENTYKPYPFDVTLAIDDPGSAPKAQITITSADQAVTQALLTVGLKAPDVTINIVLASDPDYIELTMPGLMLVQAQGDNAQITGGLSMENLLNTQFPKRTMDPIHYPAIFNVVG